MNLLMLPIVHFGFCTACVTVVDLEGFDDRAYVPASGCLGAALSSNPGNSRRISTYGPDSPVPLGKEWIKYVDQRQKEGELEAIRRSVKRGQPVRSEAWQQQVADRAGLGHTFRPRGKTQEKQRAHLNYLRISFISVR
jgi:hypothetical protein